MIERKQREGSNDFSSVFCPPIPPQSDSYVTRTYSGACAGNDGCDRLW